MNPALRRAAPERRARSRPENLKLYEGIPLDKRISVTIRPDDEKFVEMEAYFNRLLRSDSLTIREILEKHFTEHEVEQFIPTNRLPMCQWQEENTVQYQDILETQFRGKMPTLACKMAMHWFGLPVAPMRLLSGDTINAFDFSKASKEEDELDEHDREDPEEDPMAFLDNQGYGDGMVAGASGNESRLRGGGLDAEMMDTVLSDAEDDASSEVWGKQANEQLTGSLRGGGMTYDDLPLHVEEMYHIRKTPGRRQELVMYGRQGYTTYFPSWFGFLDAARYLLAAAAPMRGAARVAIDLYEKQSGGRAWTLIDTAEGPLTLNVVPDSPPEEGRIMRFVTGNMNLGHARDRNRVCFVRLARDLRADAPTLQGSDAGLIELVHEERGARRAAYMRIPSLPSLENRPSQYSEEFGRAMRNLFLGDNYRFNLTLMKGDAFVDPTPAGTIHIGEDPTTAFVSLVARAQRALREANSESHVQFSVTVEPGTPDVIPLLSPQHRVIGTHDKAQLFDLDSLIATAARHVTPSTSLPVPIAAFEVYLPAQSFGDDTRGAFVTGYEGGRPSPMARDGWRRYVEGMMEANPDRFTSGFAMMVRPIFRWYWLCGELEGGSTKHKLINLPSLDLEAFRAVVAAHLYPNEYDPFDQNQVLVLRGQAARHVVRADSTDKDWHRIRRRFAESEIDVELKLEDKTRWERETRWDVDEKSYWGPCYSPLGDLQPDGVLMTLLNGTGPRDTASGAGTGTDTPKADPDAPRVDKDSWGSSSYSLNMYMRRQAAWKQPSIFANPFKPTMPIHAPPVEDVLKVGPRMPVVTLAMRTPTEMARLQSEVHTLRGQMLDRIRECPYSDCDQYFAYGDVEELDRHLKTDHPILRCPLCAADKKKQSSDNLYFSDPDRALHHFREQHLSEMIQMAGVSHAGAMTDTPHDAPAGAASNGDVAIKTPSEAEIKTPSEAEIKTPVEAAVKIPVQAAVKTPVQASAKTLVEAAFMTSVQAAVKTLVEADFKFCHRCGRDNAILNDPRDLAHHAERCRNTDNAANDALLMHRPFCNYCGNPRPRGGVLCEKECPGAIGGGDRFCKLCAICFDGWSKLYQAQHKANCRCPGGGTADYCGFCGKVLHGKSDAEMQNHGIRCQMRPTPNNRPSADEMDGLDHSNPLPSNGGDTSGTGTARELADSKTPAFHSQFTGQTNKPEAPPAFHSQFTGQTKPEAPPAFHSQFIGQTKPEAPPAFHSQFTTETKSEGTTPSKSATKASTGAKKENTGDTWDPIAYSVKVKDKDGKSQDAPEPLERDKSEYKGGRAGSQHSSPKKRKLDGDPSYRGSLPQEEIEEEFDDRTGYKDGAAEDFSILTPGMKEIPGQWKSPVELNFPKKREKETYLLVTVSPDDMPRSKRPRQVTLSGTEDTPTPAVGTAEAPRTSKAEKAGEKGGQDAETKTRTMARPKTGGRILPLLGIPKDTGTTNELGSPLETEDVLPAPPTITRKSSRIIKRKVKVERPDDVQSDDNMAGSERGQRTAPVDPIEAGMRAAKELAKAPLKSAAKGPILKPATTKGTGRPAVKSMVRKSRKKAAADYDEETD